MVILLQTPLSDPMSFTFSIPRAAGAALDITLAAAGRLFVLGANGSGKSSLMHLPYAKYPTKSRRLSAHRQSWFASNVVTLSPEQKRNTENNIRHRDGSTEARWKDDFSAQRASIAIYDLIDAENIRARSIATAVDISNMELARDLSKKDAPIKVINELLRLSNIPITISILQNDQVMASKSGGNPYSIAELSDGERNAILIAANVLTVEPGTLLLIDEPERHLHRSIISPLLTLLFAKRTDCSFVISTHDVLLCLDNPAAQILLVRSCLYAGAVAQSWDVDLVQNASEIGEEIRKDILGARRNILFVEGTEGSLDKALYSVVFPETSIVAKSNCRDVEQAVVGIRSAANLHWVRPFGIVDNDRRSGPDIARLKTRNVYAVSAFSVESVYFHPEIQSRVAHRHAQVIGGDPQARLADAKVAALEAVSIHAERLSRRAVEKEIRDKITDQLPGQPEIAALVPINIMVDVSTVVRNEVLRFQEALAAEDLSFIIAQYPVRETAALSVISSRLGFQDRDQYEASVRKMLLEDASALNFVRSLFGALVTDIAAN